MLDPTDLPRRRTWPISPTGDEQFLVDSDEGTLLVRRGPSVQRDLRLHAALEADGVARPTGWGVDADGTAWIARPWIAGRPLGEALVDAPAERVTAWVDGLLEALEALHAAGWVHRDVKADNVIVGDDDRVTLIDLELSDDAPHRRGAGSPGHLAPELLAGQDATPASDLFALGAMLALTLGGGDPGRVTTHFPRDDFWRASGADPTRVPDALSTLVRSCVRRRPHDRPASAHAARRLLTGVERPTPALRVPFATGRRAWITTWTRDALATPGLHVLLVDDELEVPEVVRAMHASFVALGHPTSLLAPDDVLAPDADTLLGRVTLTRLDDDRDDAALVASALATAAHAVIVAPSSLGPALEAAPATTRAWPAVDVDALAEVLDEIGGHVHTATARALAQDVHARTGGVWRHVDALVARAEELGVAVRGERAWDLLLDAFPADAEELVAERLDAEAAELAAVTAWLGALPSPEDAASLLTIDVDDAAERLVRLRRLVAVDRLPRIGAAAATQLDDGHHARLAERCVEHLRADAKHDAADELEARAGNLTSETTDALLRRADAARLAGRLASARRVAAALVRRAAEPTDTARAAALIARLDMAQSSSQRVATQLSATWGGVDTMPPEILVVLALAAQQSGDRATVADAAERLVADSDATARAWGRLARAHAAFLGGDADACLQDLDDLDEAPRECRVAAANLRGVALARSDAPRTEATAALRRALDEARDAGDVAGEARAQLNLADLHRRDGDVRAEHARLVEASQAFARAGHVSGRAVALNNLGVLQRDLGDTIQARALLDEALALRRRASDRGGHVVSSISRMLATLDAGAVHDAIRDGRRAVDDAEAAGAAHHARFARTRLAWALALAGRIDEAREALAGGEEDTAAEAVARALLAHAGNRADEARTWSARAVERSRGGGRRAETLRAASLALTWTPDHGAARDLWAAAAELSPTHRAEAAWRLTRSTADVHDLEEWADAFARAGRNDLLRVVQLEIAARHDARGDVKRRRTALAAAAECIDALVDGLDEGERAATLARLDELAGARPTAADDGPLDLGWFVSCNRRMATETDLDGLLASIVDMALGVTGAQRGLIVLLDDAGEIDVHAARGLGGDDTAEHISRTLVRRAVEQGAPLVTTDALSDDRFAASASIPRFHLRSVLCVPLPASDEVRGALYVDDADATDMFDDADVAVLAALADQAALAVTQRRRAERIEGLTEALSRRVAEQEEELVRSRRMLRRTGRAAPVAGIVGESEAMQRVFHLIERLGPTDLPVLVTGPSGSGKDLVARALHTRSPRADQPLIVENVAAIPATLLESEFFGHARGAFTGADRARTGLFKEADGGTFVLDEIGEMPLELQAKLLRVLESGEYRPIGARATETTDARIVAATHRDLRERVAEGTFREDLFYRLNVAEIRVPSLTERVDDVPLLAEHGLARLNAKHGTSKRLAADVVEALAARDWPGQVRELFNEVARLYYLCGETLDDTSWIRAATPLANATSDTFDLATLERATIERALEACDGGKERAAQLLGISRAGLYAKLKRYAEADGGQ